MHVGSDGVHGANDQDTPIVSSPRHEQRRTGRGDHHGREKGQHVDARANRAVVVYGLIQQGEITGRESE